MKTKIKFNTKVLAFVLSLVILLSSFSSVSVIAETTSYEIENGVDIVNNTRYKVGDKLELLTKNYIKYNDTRAEATMEIVDPYGNKIDGNLINFNVMGIYKVNYSAQLNGENLRASQSFMCETDTYSVSSLRSEADYVTNNGVGRDGISISLARGDKFVLNQMIDLSSLTKDDTLISFYVNPSELYQYDISKIKIELIDAYDPNNIITLESKRVESSDAAQMTHFTYVTANAVGQPRTGLEKHSTGTFEYKGGVYKLHQDDAYGVGVRNSFYGGYSALNDKNNYYGKEMKFSYDASERAFYVTSIDGNAPAIIADLDDVDLFETLWSGFSHDKAILSISMDGYRSMKGNIVVTEIYGINDLTKKPFMDLEKPIIKVGEDDVAELPNGKAGIPYPLYDASAVDETYGKLDVTISVWKDYLKANQKQFTVKDNAFDPTEEGEYTVIYSAVDGAGNEATKSYVVNVEGGGPLSIVIDKTGIENVYVGTNTYLPIPTVVNAVSEYTVKVEVVSPSGKVYDISKSEGRYVFVPLESGEYILRYSCNDYVSSATLEERFTVKDKDGSYITEDPLLPKYFINGAKYSLPIINGYMFGNGTEQVNADVYVTQNGKTQKCDESFVVVATDFVTVTYSVKSNGGSVSEKTYTIPVINGTGLSTPAGLNISKFFVDGIVVDSANAKQNVNIHFDGKLVTSSLIAQIDNNGTEVAYGSYSFANAVLASRFVTEFSFIDKNFETFSIILTDSADSTKSLKFTYSMNGDKVVLLVNDEKSYSTSYKTNNTINLSYNSQKGAFLTGNSTTVYVEKYLNGEEYRGFASGKVYVNYVIDGVPAGQTATVKMLSINNQVLSGIKNDMVMPEISPFDPVGDLNLGDQITVPGFFAADVLDPTVEVFVRVLDPDGNVVKSVDGVLLNGAQDLSRAYDIVLNKYGSYKINVIINCGTSTRNYTGNFGITVADLGAPTISWGEKQDHATVGSKVNFAEYKVSDEDNDTELVVNQALITPSGNVINVDGYTGFNAAESGEYKFMVYCTDNSGNMLIDGYTITIVEE